MTAPKATSLRTDQERENAWDQYRAEQQEILDRMARQREARLSATSALEKKSAG
jgi:hypothetical protein